MVQNCKARFEIIKPTLLSMKITCFKVLSKYTRMFLGGSLCQGYTYMVHLLMNSKIQKEKASQH